MLNIVIPMAGRGSRFANAGYELPKPLIEIHGHAMIECVIKNITPKIPHKFIFLCLAEHLEKYNLETRLKTFSPNCEVVTVDKVTEGAACTVLLAEKFIDNDDALMIANSDQYVDIDINDYLRAGEGLDGLIMTMFADDNKWSFIKFDENNFVTMVREKEVISNEATVGIYNFSHGRDYVTYAKKMIELNLRVNNEFYVAPVYNMLIDDGKKIGFYNIGKLDAGMYGLGVPADLNKFLANPLSQKIFGENNNVR
ncbi:MAG: glycosyltransferase family 2 protein [Selenomonadaceae bacterium]|nr:glycosyltransferase family 2 protein [Selenomonadaceae bacterium]